MKHLFVVLLMGGLATYLSAGAITILNPSFEADVQSCAPAPNCQNIDAITNWSGSTADPGGFTGGVGASGEFGVLKPSSAVYASIPDGVNVAYLIGTTYSVSISQTLSADLLANDTYTLTVFIGAPADISGNGNFLASGQCNGFNAGLEAGGNLLNSLVTVGNASCNSLSVGAFTEFTLTYTSGANPIGLGDPLQIVLTANGSGSSIEPAELNFDAVGLSDTLSSPPSSTAPEPSTAGTLGGALVIGVLLFRSRRFDFDGSSKSGGPE
jgi:hypothetical protein